MSNHANFMLLLLDRKPTLVHEFQQTKLFVPLAVLPRARLVQMRESRIYPNDAGRITFLKRLLEIRYVNTKVISCICGQGLINFKKLQLLHSAGPAPHLHATPR